MAVSESQRKANAKHDKENFAYRSIKYKVSDRLVEQVQLAVEKGHGKSTNDYMIQAIKAKLKTDGITPDMLPDNTQTV